MRDEIAGITLSPTGPDWAETALADPAAFLSDHAHCEKKAALTALALLNRNVERDDLVLRLARLAEQEANHLRRVLEAMQRFGYDLAPDRGNPYAQALLAHARPGDLADRLFAAAMIEARSHERLALVRDAIAERDDLRVLVPFLDELIACEAGHAHTYVGLATDICRSAGEDPDARLAAWVAAEADAIASVPERSAVH